MQRSEVEVGFYPVHFGNNFKILPASTSTFMVSFKISVNDS